MAVIPDTAVIEEPGDLRSAARRTGITLASATDELPQLSRTRQQPLAVWSGR